MLSQTIIYICLFIIIFPIFHILGIIYLDIIKKSVNNSKI